MLTLVISDVLGDSLQTIASGPTLLEVPPDPVEALRVFEAFLSGGFVVEHPECYRRVRSVLMSQAAQGGDVMQSQGCRVHHHILANNATAVDAAGQEAVRLGYAYWMQSAKQSEGDVELVARSIVEHLNRLQTNQVPDCILLGGEPVVRLPTSECGRGGRNQQLVLSVLLRLLKEGKPELLRDAVFLSAGTDGEDGPTDAAGAWIDTSILEKASRDIDALERHWANMQCLPIFGSLGLFNQDWTDIDKCL